VELVNNRRSLDRLDDLTLFTQGPVFFKDDEHHIWTNVAVDLQDLQSKPEPTRAQAVGMDLFLTVDDPPKPGQEPAPPALGTPVARDPAAKKAQAQAKRKGPSVSGVERVLLRQDVVMYLYVDSNSGFLSGARDADAAKKKEADPAAGQEPAPQKSKVVIKTQGPFVYDVARYHAQFDVSDHPSPYPNRVAVTRVHELDKSDELDCERLELQFRPREAEGPKPVRDDRSLDLEIDTAHATGKEVLLKSDAEMLEAYGNDFFYDARTRQSILKGEPSMTAVKEGNKIVARELHLVEQKGAQEATALGPGWIDLFDKQTGKHPRHARWRDRLEYRKDGAFDLLVLTKDAAFFEDKDGEPLKDLDEAFRDRPHEQFLKAETLKVWLTPAEAKDGDKKDGPPPSATAAAPAEGRGDDPAAAHGRRPHHVEAVAHVVARSPELRVHDTDRLLIWFRDVPPEAQLPPARDAAPPAGPAPPGSAARPAEPTMSRPAEAPMPPPGGQPPPAAKGDAAKDPPRPIDLSARMVEAHVACAGERNELERVWSEGKVRVRQEPASADDKGVDIQGETLQLTRHAEGNVLVVTDREDSALVSLNKILIVGPVVHIDQTKNEVYVNGTGLMVLESDRNFQGEQLKRTVPLRITWDKWMYFNGQAAEYHGGVQADQETSALLCQAMQVFLDRPVSLKEGNKGDQPARVRTLSCDQQVQVEDKDFEDGKLVKYQRLECPELHVDNEEGVANAAGPGVVRILQRGSTDPQAPPAADARPGTRVQAGKPAEEELKLTRVNYAGRMYANNKTHTAIFTDNVDVVHVPSEDPNLDPNPDKLPPGGFYLRCDRLEVYTHPENGKANQEMKGKGHIFFRSEDCHGNSDLITYHEAKEQVIFEGVGGMATVYRQRVQGGKPENMRAKKIIYLRRTGEFQGIDISEFEGMSGGNKKPAGGGSPPAGGGRPPADSPKRPGG
jgi:lipopolysaccharide export system protein LptA